MKGVKLAYPVCSYSALRRLSRFSRLPRKHKQPVGFKVALEASVPPRSKVKRVKR
jgi:hypothetical protein